MELFFHRHVGGACDSRRGGDSDISPHEGVSNPASFSARSQLLTAWKHGAWSWAMPSMIVSATSKCLSLIIFVQSAQLDQHATTLALTADVSPSPPMERGKLAVIFAWCSEDGAQTLPHGCIVTFCELECLLRNQKFGLVEAHIKSSSQHAWVSCTWGIRVNNVSCLSDFFSN